MNAKTKKSETLASMYAKGIAVSPNGRLFVIEGGGGFFYFNKNEHTFLQFYPFKKKYKNLTLKEFESTPDDEGAPSFDRWSPDSNSFWTTEDFPGGSGKSCQISISSQTERCHELPSSDEDSEFSPDGSMILYTEQQSAHQNKKKTFRVRVINLQTWKIATLMDAKDKDEIYFDWLNPDLILEKNGVKETIPMAEVIKRLSDSAETWKK